MSNNKEVRFLVKKETYSYTYCSSCNGSGKKSRKFKENTFVQNCTTCGGNGRQKLTHQTEVSLMQALKELNLIK